MPVAVGCGSSGDDSGEASGGGPASIEFVELAFPDMPAALEAGRVDAVWVVEPFLSAAVGAGGRNIASNYVDTAPNLTVASTSPPSSSPRTTPTWSRGSPRR
jgi:hypothetical protein